MNLQVKDNRKSAYDPEGTVLELINAMRLVAAIHPDFKEGVCLSIESADCPTTVCVEIDSLKVNWLIGLSHAYEDWEMLKGMPTEQACAKIKELTSPRVDQPAPDQSASFLGRTIESGDGAWVIDDGVRHEGFIRGAWQQMDGDASFHIQVNRGENYTMYARTSRDFGASWGILGEVNQPAPARTAADATFGDKVWFYDIGHRRNGYVTHGNSISVGLSATKTPSHAYHTYLRSEFGKSWGFIEEQQP
jgi:hypothetical protein